MDSTARIKDLISLLTMNEDHLCDELNSLSVKINNFLNDREMAFSRHLLSVMYSILTEQNLEETFRTDANDIPVTFLGSLS